LLDSAALDAESLGDIQDLASVRRSLKDAIGIIHLAAVSRVAWGEEDPTRCRRVNVDGTRNVALAALTSPRRPWMLFVSSREVYGNPNRLPVVESDPISPVNTYGRSKAEGEQIVEGARAAGLSTASIRLPSVYGSSNDIPDRVVPALVARAMRGDPLHLTGADQLCDFLHIDDAVVGLTAAAAMLADGVRDLPTIHLASGRGTSLRELAHLVKQNTESTSEVVEAAARPFDVYGFVGSPARAREVLAWSPTVALEEGLARFAATKKSRRAASISDTVISVRPQEPDPAATEAPTSS